MSSVYKWRKASQHDTQTHWCLFPCGSERPNTQYNNICSHFKWPRVSQYTNILRALFTSGAKRPNMILKLTGASFRVAQSVPIHSTIIYALISSGPECPNALTYYKLCLQVAQSVPTYSNSLVPLSVWLRASQYKV